MDRNKAKPERLLEELATKSDLTELREEMATKSDLAELREATKSDLAELREEMATKSDLAELREEMATKSDLAELREENRKDHLELFVSIRTELRQELASHMGAIEESLSSKLLLIVEAQNRHFVRRDELAELLP